MSLNKSLKIDKRIHLDQPWKVHTLLPDFDIEDVWQVPVTLNKEDSLAIFLQEFKKSNEQVAHTGMAGLLFRIRLWVGKWFGWDPLPEEGLILPGSIRERYALAENLPPESLPHPGTADFIPVYQLENEYLSEIENKTVHAALHLGRVKSDDGYNIQMAVYVKSKGLAGRFYMKLIQPFRHLIVYPALMKGAGKAWEKYLAEKNRLSRQTPHRRFK